MSPAGIGGERRRGEGLRALRDEIGPPYPSSDLEMTIRWISLVPS